MIHNKILNIMHNIYYVFKINLSKLIFKESISLEKLFIAEILSVIIIY
jgi:hypothetical protein